MPAPRMSAPGDFDLDFEDVRVTHNVKRFQEMTARQNMLFVCGQYVLLVAGFSAVGYCAVAFVEASRYQDWARDQMGKASLLVAEPSTTRRSETMSQPTALRGVALVERINIPRLQISDMVAEGTSPQVLRVAVGHIQGTALPGQAGNVALAAHRDTFFRHLGDLKSGDLIRITVPGRQYLYSVEFTDVVLPNETWVLQPSAGQSLTLVTCYPFHYVGPAPKRFIVRARRMDIE
jgi:sortase A